MKLQLEHRKYSYCPHICYSAIFCHSNPRNRPNRPRLLGCEMMRLASDLMLKTLKQGDSNLQQLMGPHELRNALGSFINHHKLFKPLNELLKKLLNKLLKVNSICDSIKIYSSKRNVTWRHRFSCALLCLLCRERCSESDLPWRSMASVWILCL